MLCVTVSKALFRANHTVSWRAGHLNIGSLLYLTRVGSEVANPKNANARKISHLPKAALHLSASTCLFGGSLSIVIVGPGCGK